MRDHFADQTAHQPDQRRQRHDGDQDVIQHRHVSGRDHGPQAGTFQLALRGFGSGAAGEGTDLDACARLSVGQLHVFGEGRKSEFLRPRAQFCDIRCVAEHAELQRERRRLAVEQRGTRSLFGRGAAFGGGAGRRRRVSTFDGGGLAAGGDGAWAPIVRATRRKSLSEWGRWRNQHIVSGTSVQPAQPVAGALSRAGMRTAMSCAGGRGSWSITTGSTMAAVSASAMAPKQTAARTFAEISLKIGCW
jgi:hypothetical protein